MPNARVSSAASKRVFRFVFFAASGARLQEKPTDPPAGWEIPVSLGPDNAEVFIRDAVSEVAGIPRHEGLELQVVVPAADYDEGFQRARGLATTYFSALSTASRAWISTAEPVLAYEITPDVLPREFREWHREIALPFGKTPVPGAAFGSIQEHLLALTDPVETFRIRMAVEFYTAALREIEPVLRFMLFWPAAEALDDPVLRRRLTQSKGDQRHWGLKALAREIGEDPKLIDDCYDLRTDLLHVRPGRSPQQLIQQAQELGDRLETLLATAICRSLDVPQAEPGLPSGPTSADPAQIVVRAIIEGDPLKWGRDSHPHVLPKFELVRRDSDEASLQADLTATFTVQNCSQVRGPGIELWGPKGPNLGTVELSSAKVIRASGEEEEIAPDPE